MYVVFVGHPGIGKGRAINPAIKIARRANTVNILSDKLTIQYILEKLANGFMAPHLNPTTSATASQPTGFTFGIGKDASCLISAPEMEVFLTTSEALPSLSELWEAKDGPSDYGTRGKGLISIEKPCPTLVGGMTLRQIVDYMSTRVVSGGFTRRVNFIYAAEKGRSIPRPSVNGSYEKLTEGLINDLRHISTLKGEVKLTPNAWALFEPYYKVAEQGGEYDDEVLVAYSTSKWVHVLKLATILSCAENDSLTINEDQMELAIMSIEGCAKDLMRVFRAVGESDIATAADRVLHFIELKGLADRGTIMSANWRHLSAQDLDLVLTTLEQGNMVGHKDQAGKQFYYAIPQEQRTITVTKGKGVTIQ
jgi:hypothetical protein